MLLRLSALIGLAVPLACARSQAGGVVYPEFITEVDVSPGSPVSEPTGPEPAPVADDRLAEAPAEWTAELPAEPQPTFADPVRDVVYTDPGELPRLMAAGLELPLKNTAVRAHLRGEVAEVVVRQRFVNDRKAPLEAIYTFPLPENSAVTDMKMVIGERTIAAEIRERGQAKQIYRDAAAAGHTAALLEQERPNVFTQSVANIPPGESIDVELRYLQTLSYDSGEYEFVFPTVVGPRYLPGDPLARAPSGAGGRPDTDRVPDASRISPPVLGQGVRTGHDLSIDVVAEAGGPIVAWAAPAHAVTAELAGPLLKVALARKHEIPNRDFVLRYRSAGARPTARLFLGPADKRGGHFMLHVEPPRLDVDALVGARELLFVVDVSGSMHGPPLALAKAAVREALAGARPVDTFDVITFAGGTRRLFGAPRPASEANLRQALEFVDGLVAGGGTEMAAAVDTALAAPVEGGRHRYVFLLTDGYIGEEAEIARAARTLVDRQRKAGRRARVFGVGIGESPNSHLIAAISRAGDGAALHVRQPLDLPRAAQSFRRTIDSPVLTDVAVDWGALAVDDLSQALPPDLLATRPLVLHGRYTGAVPTALHLRARVGARSVTFPIEVVRSAESADTLARLWARDRIGDLELTMATTTDHHQVDRARADILALGLQHRLVTPFTSFVAVDRSRRVTRSMETIVQPVEVPAGVDAHMAGAVVVGPSGRAATKIRMDEARNIPVGGTTRDFTVIVDEAPTATRDAPGIRLVGSISAESKYVIEPTDPRDLLPGTAAEVLGGRDADLSRGFVAVEPQARARVRRVTAATEAESSALRQLVRAKAEPLAQCFVDAAPATYRLHRRLVLVIRRGPGDGLLTFEVRGREPLPDAITACLRGHLDPLLRGAVPPDRALVLELAVWMRF